MIGGVMRKLLRFVILLTVSLAVPLQGAAAVSAAQCMALGHHDTAAGHDHSLAGHDIDGKHDHKSHAPAGGAHCGPCAACCTTAAISFFVPVPIGAQAAESPVGALPSSLAGVQPDQLDRPPRLLLA
jgi:hypothetical protein